MLSSYYDTLLYIYPLIGQPKSSLLLSIRAHISHTFSFYYCLSAHCFWLANYYLLDDRQVCLFTHSIGEKAGHPSTHEEGNSNKWLAKCNGIGIDIYATGGLTKS